MKCRGEGRCCDLLNIACKVHQHHRCLLAVLWLRLEALVSIKTFWACCWKLRYETKYRENAEKTTIRSGRFDWGQCGNEIIVYKSVLSVLLDKNLAFSCGFMCDRKMSPKKLVSAAIFGSFGPTKKIFALVCPPPPLPKLSLQLLVVLCKNWSFLLPCWILGWS